MIGQKKKQVNFCARLLHAPREWVKKGDFFLNKSFAEYIKIFSSYMI